MKAFAFGLSLLFACLSVAHAQEKIITGPVGIREDKGWTYLEVNDGANSFKVSWAKPKVQLTPNRTYTFVVLFHRVTEPSIEKIFEDGRIIYDLSICELHQVRMTREERPLISGYVTERRYYPDARGEQPTLETRMQLFPHYSQVVYGGCVGWGDRTAMLYQCPICKSAFTLWEAQHATPPQ